MTARATSVAEAMAEEEGTPGTREQQRALGRLEPLFEGTTLFLYIAVGGLLAALAAALGYTLYSVPEHLGKGVPAAISTLLSELLLVLILVEIIRTILTFITTRTSSVRPFLTVAIISSVRRILSVGAELSLVEDLPREEFNRAIIELAAEGGLILVVSLSLFLVSRREGG
ncbi:MAG: phosphate-starvation-inducible PsiE family protein [Thermomicrobiales bacterium]